MNVKFTGGLIASLLFLLFLANPKISFANHISSPSGYVNDFAVVLTSEQKSSLETMLSDYEKQTGNEIALAFVKNF